MGDSSSDVDSGEESWVFYRDRPEWRDVTPLPQDDGPVPVVAIAYSDKFRDVYDYFRAILKLNEKSERALRLTADALELNSANYTVWQYRREILKALNKDLTEELEYVDQVVKKNPKNYQVWQHRKVIVEWINSPLNELQFLEEVLRDDAKNYHAWQYRQWIVHNFSLFEGEMDFVDRLIDEDIRNNSAWNQRYFVVNHFYKFKAEVISSEIDYTLKKIRQVTKNESPWNYLRGLLVHSEAGLAEPLVVDFCQSLYRQGNRSPHLLAFLIDLAAEQLQHQTTTCPPAQVLNNAKKLCRDLAEKHDSIRVEYWKYMERTLDSIANEKTIPSDCN